MAKYPFETIDQVLVAERIQTITGLSPEAIEKL
jgi:hypothetical protein